MQDGAGNTIPLAISGTVTANNQSLTTGSGSLSGTAAVGTELIASTDVSGFAEASVQFTGTFPTGSASVTPQVSNDNSTWVTTTVQNATSNTASSGNGFSALGLFRVAFLGARYFRLRVAQAGTGGTYNFAYTFNPRSTSVNSQSVVVVSTTALATGTNRIGVVTIGAGTVTIGAGTEQIGSVTANTFALQGTAVTTSNFTSTTASTVLANFSAGREVLTIFNEGAGNLHVCAGATCTTIGYQVRLSAGDYYEVPNHQTTITHSAVFATAGTARVVQIS
jgi:hypothetical protein